MSNQETSSQKVSEFARINYAIFQLALSRLPQELHKEFIIYFNRSSPNFKEGEKKPLSQKEYDIHYEDNIEPTARRHIQKFFKTRELEKKIMTELENNQGTMNQVSFSKEDLNQLFEQWLVERNQTQPQANQSTSNQLKIRIPEPQKYQGQRDIILIDQWLAAVERYISHCFLNLDICY